MRRSLTCLAAVLAAAGVAGADLVEPPDWEALAEVETVKVRTENDDGTVQRTTVWLAVVDGQGYIRTGGSRWGDNAVRDPEVEILAEGREYSLRVHFVEDEELRQRIDDAFREKYGFMDAVIGLFRGGEPLIMRLTGR